MPLDYQNFTVYVRPFKSSLSYSNARLQLLVGLWSGVCLFARRYWGNLSLISSPGLIDMLKFSPWSYIVQAACIFILLRYSLYALCGMLCVIYELTPIGIRVSTVHIALRITVANIALFYALRRCPSPVIHYHTFTCVWLKKF